MARTTMAGERLVPICGFAFRISPVDVNLSESAVQPLRVVMRGAVQGAGFRPFVSAGKHRREPGASATGFQVRIPEFRAREG
jgi:hypothetical protein